MGGFRKWLGKLGRKDFFLAKPIFAHVLPFDFVHRRLVAVREFAHAAFSVNSITSKGTLRLVCAAICS